ncbi:MAG: hypothetical protein GY859_09540 [Desulfobacterales bacterium]|nr:hypothetical protein [Desulfobacterales bacterium]
MPISKTESPTPGPLAFFLNGEKTIIDDVDPRTSLLDYLRSPEIGLTGAKEGQKMNKKWEWSLIGDARVCLREDMKKAMLSTPPDSFFSDEYKRRLAEGLFFKFPARAQCRFIEMCARRPASPIIKSMFS